MQPMNTAGKNNIPPGSESRTREHIVIFILCALAGIRIFLFNAAFPPFNNVDEEHHFDMVYKYSTLNIPRVGVECYSPQTLRIISQCQSPEYVLTKDMFAGSGIRFSGWTDPNILRSEPFKRMVALPPDIINTEAGNFPVYYTIAGLWCAIGRFAGPGGAELVYWVRFLNVPLFVLLVWFSYLTAKMLFTDNPFGRMALPLLVAFFPQDIFYGITNDSLSPVLFGISFFMLLKILFERKSHYYALMAGLAVSATFLTKIPNFTALVLCGLVILIKCRHLSVEKNWKDFRPLITLGLAAIVPAGLWLLRNRVVLGDVFATAAKINYFGWKVKPLSQMFDHPIFTIHGFLYFITELTKTFWRGEFVWHQRIIASVAVDDFYVFSTAVFAFISLLFFIFKSSTNSKYKFAIGSSFGLLIISALFLAVLSIIYDFGDSWYPSRQCPFFTSGRLISGVLAPFLLIYLDGLMRLVRKTKIILIIAILIAVLMLVSEIVLSWDVFKSPYNWFHYKFV